MLGGVESDEKAIVTEITDVADVERKNRLGSSVCGEQGVIVINRTAEIIQNQELQDEQNEANSTLTSNKQTAEDYQYQMDNHEYPLWPEGEPSRRQIAYKTVIFGVIGFLVGALLVIFYYYIRFVYGGRLYSEKELRSLLGIRCLGKLIGEEEASKKKRYFAKVLYGSKIRNKL